MKPLTACLLAVLALLAATATSQQFPFTEGPLEPSVNSNKVFFKLKEVADISGVWKGVNAVIFPIFGESWLSDGVTPFNLTCDAVKSFGWSYDLFITSPRATVIEADPENLEPGTIGRISHYGGALGPFPDDILDFETDGRMHHRNDSSYCSKLRPYLDWELGKTMMVQNRRNFYWEDENGATAMGGEECEFSGITHPDCFEGTFTHGGVERTGVIVDMIAYYECIAGPCLDLAHGLPGFVQTQGYVPVEPEETLIGSADEVAVDSTTGR